MKKEVQAQLTEHIRWMQAPRLTMPTKVVNVVEVRV